MKQLLKSKCRLLTVIIMVAAAAVSMQSRAEFRWGPTAGVDITTLKFKQSLIDVDKTVGPTVGVQGEMMFSGIGFGIDIAALYSMQGANLHLGKWPMFSSEGYGDTHAYLHTLSIPIDLRFKWTRMNGIEDWVAPFVVGGPVFNFTFAHNSLKALQFPVGSIGIQAGLGVEVLKKWQIQGGYVWGMTFATKFRQLLDYSGRERYWTVRVTYMF